MGPEEITGKKVMNRAMSKMFFSFFILFEWQSNMKLKVWKVKNESPSGKIIRSCQDCGAYLKNRSGARAAATKMIKRRRDLRSPPIQMDAKQQTAIAYSKKGKNFKSAKA